MRRLLLSLCLWSLLLVLAGCSTSRPYPVFPCPTRATIVKYQDFAKGELAKGDVGPLDWLNKLNTLGKQLGARCE